MPKLCYFFYQSQKRVVKHFVTLFQYVKTGRKPQKGILPDVVTGRARTGGQSRPPPPFAECARAGWPGRPASPPAGRPNGPPVAAAVAHDPDRPADQTTASGPCRPPADGGVRRSGDPDNDAAAADVVVDRRMTAVAAVGDRTSVVASRQGSLAEDWRTRHVFLS